MFKNVELSYWAAKKINDNNFQVLKSANSSAKIYCRERFFEIQIFIKQADIKF